MKVGIIGGSGLDNPEILSDYEEREIETPYGSPSSRITCGKISNVEVCILARHGRDHEIAPSQVNFRANIYALKSLGCTHILATSAVGSLKEEIVPGDLIFPDQFIDFTKQRKNTFYDSIGEVKHLEMAHPFSEKLRKILVENANLLGFRNHEKATIVVIEGPRFSTKSESLMFRNFADIIGMTTVPECILAKELEIEYASIAMATDYDCWKENELPVTFEMVMQRMKENAEKVKKLLIRAVPLIADGDLTFLKNKIRTVPNFPRYGIMFRDITTLLSDHEGIEKVIEIFYEKYKDYGIDIIAGIESRGFIIGGMLANRLKKGFVPLRKPGKLPYETIKESYMLEYGSDSIEIHRDAIKPGQKVLLIDDLIATGGTALAAANLIERLGGKIAECAFVIELPELKGRMKLENKGHGVFSVVSFEGH